MGPVSYMKIFGSQSESSFRNSLDEFKNLPLFIKISSKEMKEKKRNLFSSQIAFDISLPVHKGKRDYESFSPTAIVLGKMYKFLPF